MREYPARFVKSQGAIVGLESYSGPQAFDLVADELRMLMIATCCQDIPPLLLIGEDRPVFGMDMRGQTIRGGSVQDKDFSIAKCNTDFDAVLNSLQVKKAAFLGYSPGGFFAAHYAIANPDKVAALILAEPAIFTDTEDLIQRARLAEGGDAVRAMEAMLQYIDPSISKEQKNALAKEVVKDWQSSEIMGKVFRLHGEEQIQEKDLEALRKFPVLLIGGSESPMNFHIKRIAAAVPEATVWWVRGATHLDLFSEHNASEIADVVGRFLKSLDIQTSPNLTFPHYRMTEGYVKPKQILPT